MSWYFVSNVLQTPVSNIIATSTGITALTAMVIDKETSEYVKVVDVAVPKPLRR